MILTAISILAANSFQSSRILQRSRFHGDIFLIATKKCYSNTSVTLWHLPLSPSYFFSIGFPVVRSSPSGVSINTNDAWLQFVTLLLIHVDGTPPLLWLGPSFAGKTFFHFSLASMYPWWYWRLVLDTAVPNRCCRRAIWLQRFEITVDTVN